MIAFDTNKSAKFLNDNLKEYKRFLKTQKLIRDIDEIHIIDQNKKLLFSNIDNLQNYIPPLDGALKLVLGSSKSSCRVLKHVFFLLGALKHVYRGFYGVLKHVLGSPFICF